MDDWCYEVPAGGLSAGPTPEETAHKELLEVRLVAAEDALRMARSGEISDGPSALALLWCEALLTVAHQ